MCLGRSRKDAPSASAAGATCSGSGYRLALEALRLATQTVDGRADAEALVRAVLRHWSLADAGALIGHVHAPSMTPADIASLAPVIVTLAAGGDPAARGLVEQGVKDLARQVDTAIRKLALSSPP